MFLLFIFLTHPPTNFNTDFEVSTIRKIFQGQKLPWVSFHLSHILATEPQESGRNRGNYLHSQTMSPESFPRVLELPFVSRPVNGDGTMPPPCFYLYLEILLMLVNILCASFVVMYTGCQNLIWMLQSWELFIWIDSCRTCLIITFLITNEGEISQEGFKQKFKF